MRFALVNPPWDFSGSIYFGCREPHLPLEYGYAAALLEQHGHEAVIIDGQFDGLSRGDVRRRVSAAAPDFVVITTAPSYLFWRCAPPELRVPLETVADLADLDATFVVVGPHASTTPGTTLRKLNADVAVMGECEEILPLLATREWRDVPSIAWREDAAVHVQGGPHASDMMALPALHWPDHVIGRSRHHHHRFDAAPTGPGAQLEATRGCPYHCTFCAKDNFRNQFRKRPLATVAAELDALIAQGVEYVYFIDEIFLPHPALLDALAARPIRFGVQMRIDLWTPEFLDRLGAAGCVSIEAGVESISEEGRKLLDKKSRMTTAGFTERLIRARQTVPFVQANLLDAQVDRADEIEEWRRHLQRFGVWANKPVPLFPYPGSPDYTRRWGAPDDEAWERAHAHYLRLFAEFSDIQEHQPTPLPELEQAALAPSAFRRTRHTRPPR